MKTNKFAKVFTNIGLFLFVLSLYAGVLVVFGLLGVIISWAVGWLAWFVMG